MKHILVTGATGQLGMCLQKIQDDYSNLNFTFFDSKSLDITDSKSISVVFSEKAYDYCINCAAYTNVEEAEKSPKEAFEVNAKGVKSLSEACLESGTILIHISTDYVFDGEKETGYLPEDKPNPINEYGKSKLQGEHYIQEILKEYFIIRTSWLYSEFGKNFYKTILAKARAGENLLITNEQVGCPTNANNLAKYILNLTQKNIKDYGIYHFTDGKAMSWFKFGQKILEQNGLRESTLLEKAKNNHNFAKRPKNSVLK